MNQHRGTREPVLCGLAVREPRRDHQARRAHVQHGHAPYGAGGDEEGRRVEEGHGQVGEAEDAARVTEGVWDGERLDEEGGHPHEEELRSSAEGREAVGEPDLPPYLQ